MEHKKYDGIVGTWSAKNIEYLRLKGFDHKSIKWCVTEKVHGSNFAFYINQDEIKVAKRNGFLAEGENFFQYTRMNESNGWKVRQLWDYLCGLRVTFGDDDLEPIKEIIVYGELCGGVYEHPDVIKPPNVRKIQKGVSYHPDIIFYCFDIMVNGIYLDMNALPAACEFNDIFYAKILKTGTFDECMECPDEFQSLIPKWLGLPPIENNVCEGIVLKPLSPMFYEDGDRVILKSKNQKFLEVSKERKQRPVKQKAKLSEFGKLTLTAISTYITENRLNNVISKFGEPQKKDFRAIWQLFKDDVLEDFEKNYTNVYSNLDELDKPLMMKIIGTLCTEVWRPIFLRIT